MRRYKWIALWLALCLALSLAACGSTDSPAPTENPDSAQSGEIQYDYQLKAGETREVYDTVFDQPVTVTVDPNSSRDGGLELRSGIYFDNCTFNSGLNIIGDYHAMVSLGPGCSFAEGAVVSFEPLRADAGEGMGLEDNFVKLFVSCEGVAVETDYSVGVVTDGPDISFNGSVFSKQELAPDWAFLGIYSVYENDSMSYIKLAIGEDDSMEVLE